MKRLTASRLRTDIYRVLDSVIDTGKPVELERRGRIVKITVEPLASKLGRLVERPGVIRGKPADLVDVEWSGSWKP